MSIKNKKKELFLIFVHYGLDSKFKKEWEISDDLEDLISLGLPQGDTFFNALFDQMKPRLLNLYKLLKSCDNDSIHGFAYVFLDPGWTALLNAWQTRRTADNLRGSLGALQMELKSRLNNVQHSNEMINLSGRIRIVTAHYLANLVKDVPRAFKLFAGETNNLLYDGPKVVEAAIRIANIGRNVPIFRFDDDVIFYKAGETAKGKEKAAEIIKKKEETYARKTRRAIKKLRDHFTKVSNDPDLNYFFFSGHYQEKNNYIDGFATRFVQLADRSESVLKWKGIRDEVCEKFLNSLKGYSKNEEDKPAEKKECGLGANPRGQVISGAGLCLSDSAILDLPPFSNMRQNIIWIDDHLKYALHHELRHFGFRKGTGQVARVDATFKQSRHNKKDEPNLKDVKWHLQYYMMRLILGCVVDKWLREIPEIKLKISAKRFNELMEDEKEENGLKSPGAYASKFQNVLLYGWGPDEEKSKKDLKNNLWRLARQRLNEIVDQWKQGYEGTFLELYMSAPSSRFSEFLPESIREGGLVKAVERMPDDYPQEISLDELTKKKQIEYTLEEAVVQLTEDFVDYIDLVRSWKDFIRATRNLLNWKRTREVFNWIHPGDKGRVNKNSEDGTYPG
jgi:hypothetical protein